MVGELLSHHGSRLLDGRVALGVHFIAFLDAEGLVEDFGLEANGHEIALLRPFRHAGLDAARGQESLELVHQRWSHGKVLADFVVAQILGGESGERSRGLQHRSQPVQRRRLHRDVRLNPAAAQKAANIFKQLVTYHCLPSDPDEMKAPWYRYQLR